MMNRRTRWQSITIAWIIGFVMSVHMDAMSSQSTSRATQQRRKSAQQARRRGQAQPRMTQRRLLQIQRSQPVKKRPVRAASPSPVKPGSLRGGPLKPSSKPIGPVKPTAVTSTTASSGSSGVSTGFAPVGPFLYKLNEFEIASLFQEISGGTPPSPSPTIPSAPIPGGTPAPEPEPAPTPIPEPTKSPEPEPLKKAKAEAIKEAAKAAIKAEAEKDEAAEKEEKKRPKLVRLILINNAGDFAVVVKKDRFDASRKKVGEYWTDVAAKTTETFSGTDVKQVVATLVGPGLDAEIGNSKSTQLENGDIVWFVQMKDKKPFETALKAKGAIEGKDISALEDIMQKKLEIDNLPISYGYLNVFRQFWPQLKSEGFAIPPKPEAPPATDFFSTYNVAQLQTHLLNNSPKTLQEIVNSAPLGAGELWHTKYPTAIYFYASNDPYYEFTNFWHASITDDKGDTWVTSEVYFQAQKFKYLAVQGNPFIYNLIKAAKSPREAFTIAANYRNDVDQFIADLQGVPSANPAWIQESDFNAVEAMYPALVFKFAQHRNLLKILLDTGDQVIVEDTAKAQRDDTRWGNGKADNGRNYLGRLLMYLRSKANDFKKSKGF